ncbi:DUF6531 domain-containing protein [Kribbella sp. NPDC051770]|uniref:DUF6531 domain-containing protein n=1 Tax=Kribbella sp. NPDC051770 TaxID=3155413 RepID=UPI003431474E
MRPAQRALCLLLALLLVLPWTTQPAAGAPREDGLCIHVDVSVTADGELLTKGPQIASDGGFGHAGTGQTFTFTARTFAASMSICAMLETDARTWEISSWPCANQPRPKPARTQSLTWSVDLPLDCDVPSSPGLLGASVTNGKAAASGEVFIYAGAPGFALPDKQARGLFGPFAMQSDPVNSLTGGLTAVETDAAVTGLGVPLSVDRTYNSNDPATGPLGPGWRTSYSDKLVLAARSATYQASDGREIAFTQSGTGFVIEPGAARLTLTRSGTDYLLTDIDQQQMRFSSTGELLSILDRNGQGVTITHDSGRVNTVTNGQRSLEYTYDNTGLLTAVVLSAPSTEPRRVQYEYADGKLAAVTSPGGLRTEYGYDDGRLTTEKPGDASRPTVTTEYDGEGRVVSQTDGKGAKSSWTWETSGIRGRSTMTDPTGGRWINEYERNWLVRQTDPTGVKVTFHYDSMGNLIRVFDPLGHGARHTYDRLGRVTSSTDAGGFTTRRAYGASNDPVSTTDPLGRRSTFSYDSRGNLVASSSAGKTSSVTYDTRGLPLSTRDVLGRTTRFAYSPSGDLTAVTDPAGNVTRYEVDGWGRIVKVTGPRKQTTMLTYSADDQPLESHGPLGQSSRLDYDSRGRLSTSTDARGGTTRYRYDDAGQLVGVTAPSLPEATAEFDASGRVTKRTDASGRAQTSEYDAAGRLTATTYGGRTWRFTHDKAGRLIRTTLPSGKSASFTLDARGAMTRVDYSDKTPSNTFTWDAAGRRTTMTDAGGTTRFTYDAFDQLTSASRPGSTVAYRWDSAGNLAARTAAGHTESYTWDAVNRLTSAKVDGKPAATYTYDVARGKITSRRPSGLTETRSYDLRGRETELRLTQPGKPVRTVVSSYDPAGNLVLTNDSVAGKSAYTYDPLNQLTAVCYDVDQCTDDAKDYIRYAYDGAGNRTWEERPTSTKWSLFGAGNELQASIIAPNTYPRDPPRATFNTYDPDGNLTSDGTTTYTWTASGKPATSTTATTKTTYTHTADGRRLTQSTAGKTTSYLWDPLSPQILSTTTAQSTTRHTYARGLLTTTTSGRSTTHTTTPTGTVLPTTTEPHPYEPFGAKRPLTPTHPSVPTPPAPSPAFTGALQLPTGNYLLGQREYNPTTGTFLSPDQGASSHPYSYAGNNPLTRTDLTGLDDINGTLTDVSNISGWISIGTIAAAVGCTIYRPCAPAIPILMQVSSATGVVSGVAGGALSAEACVVKGNCSHLAGELAIAGLASRLPGGKVAGRFPTMSGRAAFGGADHAMKNMLKYSDRNPKEGFYDILGHGSPDDIAGQSASEIAAKVRPVYGGQDIRLLSCWTACPSGSFAQDLADELGVRVLAPTTEIGASNSGKTLDIYDGGTWLWFEPRK